MLKCENNKCGINKVLPDDKNMQLVYTGTRTGTKFNVKDKTKKGHHLNLTFSVKSCMKNRPDSCNSETGRMLIERVNKHGKDINSNMFKHSIEGIQQ